MADIFRLLLAQLNPVLGDLRGNAEKARAAWAEGQARGADCVALTEMFLTGYQTQDLVRKPAFLADVAAVLAELAAATADGPALGIGAPFAEGGRVYNAYFLFQNGALLGRALKHNLPNEAVFDEKRVFDAAPLAEVAPIALGPLRLGLPICEDAWHPEVAAALAAKGADLLLVPNGSPYHRGKPNLRHRLMSERVVETGLPLVYLNMVGGQDDQVFDGSSMVLNPGAGAPERALQMPQFDTCLTEVRFEKGAMGWRAAPGPVAEIPEIGEADYRACVMGLGDYMGKTGFQKALLGLSGGIDSALVAAMAVDALGAENLQAVMLPSVYTAQSSLEDAAACAKALGIGLESLPITGPQSAVEAALAPLFAGRAADVTEENIQSRLRGLLLMALSNKFGALLLTTGNKSEMATGYCTLYGDMNGAYNPLKDMYKTRVFAVARWRNENHRPWMKGPAGAVIPENILTKAPSAELRPGQTDQDSLPPYPVLDAILEGLIEREASLADLIAEGHKAEIVRQVERLLYLSEYKRHQAAPGPRLTQKALWLDRRYPLVQRWRDGGKA